jgi:hypothetical protein
LHLDSCPRIYYTGLDAVGPKVPTAPTAREETRPTRVIGLPAARKQLQGDGVQPHSRAGTHNYEAQASPPPAHNNAETAPPSRPGAMQIRRSRTPFGDGLPVLDERPRVPTGTSGHLLTGVDSP